MVQIDFMHKPETCCECPFYKKLENRYTYTNEKNEYVPGVYVDLYQCMFANDYAENNFEDDDEADDFTSNNALHSTAEKEFLNYIEPWCPIKEIE